MVTTNNDLVPDNLELFEMHEADQARKRRVSKKNAINELSYERELEEIINE